MNILQIYQKYFLPENLQLHMLRVGACSRLIMDNWTGSKLDEDLVVRVLLLHDMGNIVKIPKEVVKDVNFCKIQQNYIKEYGTNDHELNLHIGKIEGLNEKEMAILDGKRSRKNEETLRSSSYERKICAYCDQRVAPNGVIGIVERLEDAKVRYRDKPLSVWANEEKANYLIHCALEIERQIIQFCQIQPKDINDKSIEAYVEKLKEYEI